MSGRKIQHKPKQSLGQNFLVDENIARKIVAAIDPREDEVIMEIEVINALRPVLRYRTMLLRGEPEEEYRGHWEAAQLLFPRWVGFRPRRMRWTRWCESAFRYMEGETRRLLRHADAFDRAERVAEIRARITELEEAGGADDEAEAP